MESFNALASFASRLEQACRRRGICYLIPSASASAQSWLGLMRRCWEGAASGASGGRQTYYQEAEGAPMAITDKMKIKGRGPGTDDMTGEVRAELKLLGCNKNRYGLLEGVSPCDKPAAHPLWIVEIEIKAELKLLGSNKMRKLGVGHQIQHFDIAFSKVQYDHPNAVKTADVTCIRLY